jgi:hypothetical protein
MGRYSEGGRYMKVDGWDERKTISKKLEREKRKKKWEGKRHAGKKAGK